MYRFHVKVKETKNDNHFDLGYSNFLIVQSLKTVHYYMKHGYNEVKKNGGVFVTIPNR